MHDANHLYPSFYYGLHQDYLQTLNASTGPVYRVLIWRKIMRTVAVHRIHRPLTRKKVLLQGVNFP